MVFQDFVQHEIAVRCSLSPAEVLALRLYTTQVFSCVNGPLRDLERRARGDAHPLPVTTTHLMTGIKKLRTIPAQDYSQTTVRQDYYRGISNATILEQFLREGGTELALMSGEQKSPTAPKRALLHTQKSPTSPKKALYYPPPKETY